MLYKNFFEGVYMIDDKKRKTRITVNFREGNNADQELYKWIIQQGEIIGVSNAIKQILAKVKEAQEDK